MEHAWIGLSTAVEELDGLRSGMGPLVERQNNTRN
jgi:hypothetical protein